MFWNAEMIILVLLSIDSLKVFPKHFNVMNLEVYGRNHERKNYEKSLEYTTYIPKSLQVSVWLPVAPVVDISKIKIDLKNCLSKGAWLRSWPIQSFHYVDVWHLLLYLHNPE